MHSAHTLFYISNYIRSCPTSSESSGVLAPQWEIPNEHVPTAFHVPRKVEILTWIFHLQNMQSHKIFMDQQESQTSEITNLLWGVSKPARNNMNNTLHWWLLHDNKESEWPAVHAVFKTKATFTHSQANQKKTTSKQLNRLAHSCPA